MMMMALRRLFSNGWTVCRLRWISIIDKGIVPAQDAQITGDCYTQEVQMNRVLKAVVLFLILTGIAWQAVAFSEVDLEKLKSSLKCPKCDLAGADLSGAKLAGANLTYANLDKARFFRAELAGANLSEAVLTGADLFNADLTGVDLSGANLIDAYMEDTNLQDANLAGADLTKAYLEATDLTGANLTMANLTGAFLEGTNLENADLTGAVLTDAKLNWVKNLSKAILCRTTMPDATVDNSGC